VERLDEIRQEIKVLVEEASDLLQELPNQMIWERARCYWYKRILGALDEDNEYLGGSGWTMKQTTEEVSNKGDVHDEL
jgi:hypothetical protein